MGDPTSIGDYPEAMDNYDLVPSGLIKLIKQNFNAGLDHAGVELGQPTAFIAGCALNLSPVDIKSETKNLNRKLKAGADFILTQPVFNPRNSERLLSQYADQYEALETPILAGILPLYGLRHATFLHNEVPGISIPDRILERLEEAGGDSPQAGISIAIELIEEMKTWASGIYLMPAFNRFDLAAEIVDYCRSLVLLSGSRRPTTRGG